MIFQVNTSIDVTALGLYDSSGTTLQISHDVGIYNQTTQTLVASTTVPAGSCGTLVDGFCFGVLGSPVLLNPGDYVSVLTMPADNGDLQFGLATSITTAGEITYLNSAFDVGANLHFPNPANNGDFAKGFAGPNFLFQAAVPEPAGVFLLGAVVAILLAAVPRREWLGALGLTRSGRSARP
jgi:hypothetical protein